MATVMATSSSRPVAATVPHKKYDVFINFRGHDTRVGFTSHLESALCRNYFLTYTDYRIKSGKKIWDELVKAMNESTLFLVVFSENYADSSWCLDELVEIMKCRRKSRQVVVLPVFYRIEPSYVRKQTGSYGAALARHSQGHRDSHIQLWKDALREAGNLSGFHVTEKRSESAWIEDINKAVLKTLRYKYKNELTFNFKTDENYSKIQSSINFDSSKVQIIGIWGAKGIGKTAIVAAMFQNFSCKYQGTCFLEKVAEESKRNGINFTYKKLVSTLLGEDVNIDTPIVMSSMVIRRLKGMKAFIVLDDVRSPETLKTLIRERGGWLGAGSIVIVTTRDEDVLKSGGISNTHKVRNSLRISYLNKFTISLPKQGFLELSRKAIHYVNCNPIALKVLRSFHRLYTSEIDWKCALAKLKEISNAKIMRWTYKFQIWGTGQVWALFQAYRSMKVMFGHSVRLIEK